MRTRGRVARLGSAAESETRVPARSLKLRTRLLSGSPCLACSSDLPLEGSRLSEPGDRSEREAAAMAAQAVHEIDGAAQPESEPLVAKPAPLRRQRLLPPAGSRLRAQLVSTAPGRTLDPDQRGRLETALKSDFSTVRVHTDERAARATDALDADAFAVGNDIFFARSRFAPSTPGGRELLAHELAHVRQNQMRPTGGLGQPTIQRRVRPNFVSCQGYPRTYPIFTAIGTTDPVPMVEAADRRAIEMLDDVIGELQHARDAIVNGAPAAWPTVSDVVAGALQNRFGIDPSDTAVWTGTGEGTVRVIIRRYEAIRRVLQGGWVHYTCLGANCGTEWAYVTGPNYVVNLCRLWWRSPDSDERALTLIHELLHVYFWSFMGDTGALGNAHRYDQFLSDIQ